MTNADVNSHIPADTVGQSGTYTVVVGADSYPFTKRGRAEARGFIRGLMVFGVSPDAVTFTPKEAGVDEPA